jgi:hypothetical protein
MVGSPVDKPVKVTSITYAEAIFSFQREKGKEKTGTLSRP